jgi:hypothetical protein
MTATKIKTFTYIGKGEDSPYSINFMGKIPFVRGQSVNIDDTLSNEFIINKLQNNPSFQEGIVKAEVITIQDKEAKQRADENRGIDKRIDATIKKQNLGIKGLFKK